LPQNLRTVLSAQEEAVAQLTSKAMHQAGLEQDLIERVERCRANATTQGKLLDREVKALQDQSLQKGDKADLGEEKILQRYGLSVADIPDIISMTFRFRGWVGNDGKQSELFDSQGP
jgi:hypothetical protein